VLCLSIIALIFNNIYNIQYEEVAQLSLYDITIQAPNG